MDAAAKNLSAIESLPRLRIVILAMTWDHNGPMWTPMGRTPAGSASKLLPESLDRLILNLQSRGKIVILIGPIKPPTWEAASVVARDLAFGHRITEPLFFSENEFMAEQGDTIQHYASRKDIIFIRPDLIQCMKGRCDYFRDGAPLFADTSHIAETALPLFRPVSVPGLQEAFLLASQSCTGSHPLSSR
jgi:hypothetical protein